MKIFIIIIRNLRNLRIKIFSSHNPLYNYSYLKYPLNSPLLNANLFYLSSPSTPSVINDKR